MNPTRFLALFANDGVYPRMRGDMIAVSLGHLDDYRYDAVCSIIRRHRTAIVAELRARDAGRRSHDPLLLDAMAAAKFAS